MADRSNPLAVDQPTRRAEQNHSLTDEHDPPADGMVLPSLEPEIILLDVEDARGVLLLQSLVLDHLLMNDGPAYWVDAHGHATTTSLARIAPSQRLLDRIHVARGFTAYQHHAAVCDLPTAALNVTHEARERSTAPPDTNSESTAELSLIVVPYLDAQYRADESLPANHAERLQARTLAQLAARTNDHDVPVLVTRSTPDEFTESIATAADRHLSCEQTEMGPRIVGDEFETLVYPIDDGSFYQTTFAYWRQLLTARATQAGAEPGTVDNGNAVAPVTGRSPSTTADPLLDAWTTTTGGR